MAKKSFALKLRNYFFTGVVVLIPIGFTLFLTKINFCKESCIIFYQKYLHSWIDTIVKYLKIIT